MARTDSARAKRKSHAFSQRILRRPYRATAVSAREPCTRVTPKCDLAAHGGNRPECCTSHLFETAIFVDELLTRQGIAHWLDWGSLLGAVRDQTLIPWDGDVDFGAVLDDWGPLLDLTAEIQAAGFHLKFWRKRARIYYSRVNHLGADIYRHERRGAMVHYPTKDPTKRPEVEHQEAFPASFVETFETVHLYDRPFPAPSPVVPFLVNHRYGPAWKIPLRHIKGITYPDLNGEELSPTVERLLQRLSESQDRLLVAKAGLRPTRSIFWSRHGDPGLPTLPKSDILDTVLAAILADQRNGVVHELAVTIAAFDQAGSEIETPDLGLWLERITRTAVNVAVGMRLETQRVTRRLRRKFRRARRSAATAGSIPGRSGLTRRSQRAVE